jgi:hypothetical protein
MGSDRGFSCDIVDGGGADGPPKLIDTHEHFNGASGVLKDLLGNLEAADGIGFLLVTPTGFSDSVTVFSFTKELTKMLTWNTSAKSTPRIHSGL